MASVVTRSGKLRHQVIIQSESQSRDSYDVDYTWATAETVRASISPVSGTEQITGEGETSTQMHKVTLRYTANAVVGNRILWGSRVLWIEQVVNVDERNRRVDLICREDVS